MEFKRGSHHCDADTCKDGAAYTLTLYVGTPGKQAVRLKRASKVARLCKSHLMAFAHGVVPMSLRSRFRDVI